MVEQSQSCPKCHGPMEEGFLAAQMGGGYAQAEWVEGEPERSAWSGLKMKGRNKYGISGYRCSSCGYLEFYTVGASETLLRAAEPAATGQSQDLLRAADGTVDQMQPDKAAGGEEKYE